MRRQQLMDFSDALCLLKEGKSMNRLDFEDVFEYITLIDDTFLAKSAMREGLNIQWIVNQEDLIAEDWIEVPDQEKEE